MPGLGEIADGLNSLIYTGRGDYVNAGLSAAAMVPFGGWAATGGKLTKKAIWTSTKKLSSVENAFAHFLKHGDDFPELYNAKKYVEGTKDFLNNSPAGTLIKTRDNGDILKYHPGTNTFGVMDASGIPRTMFKPADGMLYWKTQ